MTDPIKESEIYLLEDRGSLDAEDKILKDSGVSEFTDDYTDNEALAYSITALLGYFDQYNEGVISQTRFNKLIYILNYELIKEDIDVRLPYFWYLYGPVIPLNFFPSGLIQLLSKPWGKGIKICEYRRPNLSENVRTRIDLAARNIYRIYGQLDPSIMTEEIIYAVYKIAPYLFQNKYKKLQYQIKRKIRDRDILLKLGPLDENRDIKKTE